MVGLSDGTLVGSFVGALVGLSDGGLDVTTSSDATLTDLASGHKSPISHAFMGILKKP